MLVALAGETGHTVGELREMQHGDVMRMQLDALHTSNKRQDAIEREQRKAART
jgi:hypothetical protein